MESTLTFLADYGTDLWFPALVTAAIAYFCGCFNGAVIVSKYILRDDVRNHGSGNAGNQGTDTRTGSAHAESEDEDGIDEDIDDVDDKGVD